MSKAMAEYIDRFIIGGLVDSHNNVHYEDIKGIPTADVVERAEINEAIENIKECSFTATLHDEDFFMGVDKVELVRLDTALMILNKLMKK